MNNLANQSSPTMMSGHQEKLRLWLSPIETGAIVGLETTSTLHSSSSRQCMSLVSFTNPIYRDLVQYLCYNRSKKLPRSPVRIALGDKAWCCLPHGRIRCNASDWLTHHHHFKPYCILIMAPKGSSSSSSNKSAHHKPAVARGTAKRISEGKKIVLPLVVMW